MVDQQGTAQDKSTADELYELREGWDFEAKLAAGRDGRGAVPRSFWSTYSAMANSRGGLVLLGAEELSDGTLNLTGISDVERVERDLWNTLQNPGKVSANILGEAAVERRVVDGKVMLLIRIPKAPRAVRPLYLNRTVETGTFIRVHDGDRRLQPEEARRLLADRMSDRDAKPLTEFSLTDLSADSVSRYREFLAARRPDHPFLDESGEDFLMAIGAAVRDRRGDGRMRPTLAGLLMLGRESAIRELLPHWHLSFKELPSAPGDDRRWVDRIHPDGMWNANVFEFYRRAIIKLQDGLKVPFAMEHGQYRVDETDVHGAVREALVNALVHADYQGPGGIRVSKGRSGFEFVNPGLLLVTPRQLWRGGVSQARNPALQRLFGLLRLGEREGSGGPAMRNVWRAQHWRAPRIIEDQEHLETRLELSQESLLPERAVQSVAQRHGEAFTQQNELGRIILVTAEVEQCINHSQVCELSDEHPRDVTLKLQELVRKGLLTSSGRTRATTYAPAPEQQLGLFATSSATDTSSADTGTSSSDTDTSSADTGTSSSDTGTSSSDTDTSSADTGTSSSDTGTSSSDTDTSFSDTDTSSPDTDTRRGGSDARRRDTENSVLQRVTDSAWAPCELLDRAILLACRDGYLTTHEIAARVGRARGTVARRLPALAHHGRLLKRYPDANRHPRQAYRAPQDEGLEQR